MSRTTGEVLLIATDRPREALRWTRQRYGDDPVSVVCLDHAAEDESLPASWRRLRVAELLDTEALRRDFLEFLDAWPRRPLCGGKSFDQLFRRPEGYSLWWTGPGIQRHPDLGVFAQLRTLWLCDRAIRAVAPRLVLIHTRQADLARSLASRGRSDGCRYEFLPGSVRPAPEPWRGRLPWLLRTLAGLCVLPCFIVVRAAIACVLARAAPETRRRRNGPAIVFLSPFTGRTRLEPDQDSWYLWQQTCDALAGMAADVRRCYLLTFVGSFHGYRKVMRLYHTGWRLVRNLRGAWPVKEKYPALGALFRSLPHQLALLARYYRLEAAPQFRSSWVFAGADVSGFYVPALRQTLARLSLWSQTVAATARSLQAIGNVKAAVISEEMYPLGIMETAAARSLGIPSVGVQHGTIMPMHLVYTLPPGQVESGPIPDYFAAYGPFAKEVLSVLGAYPADRVWVTGGARFDHLVNEPQDACAARQRLGLPPDKRIVLVTTQLFSWFPAAAEAVFEATKGRKDCLVCLKTHPKDLPLDVYRDMARKLGAENVAFFTERFDELLTACDVLISASSTTILEAILLGRKTVCINFSLEPDKYPYVADGGSLDAGSKEELSAALDRAFSQEYETPWAAARKRFLQRHAGPAAEGRAAETLARKVLQLCGREERPPAA